MGLLRELWTGEIIDKLRFTGEFLSRVPSRNDLVNNNAIHLVDIGTDPEVLINNTTYPIATAGRTDEDVTISLDKFDTENTKITDDELFALPYDKPGSVIAQHRGALEEKIMLKAAHSLAPTSNGALTPVIPTTGNSNGYTIARKRLKIDDLILLSRMLDDAKIPRRNRLLVLCSLHTEDLLLTSEAFQNQYKNIKTGDILPLFGFEIYPFLSNPVYYNNGGTITKKAFGAASVPASEFMASFAFYTERATQCRGDVTMYYKRSETDPENRDSVIGFRTYQICLPKKAEGFGAIYSAGV